MNVAQFQNITSILGMEHSIAILEELVLKPWQTASEIAHELSIHIATAQKYLDKLKEVHILDARVRKTRARSAVEYRLVQPNIILDLDMNEIVEGKAEEAYRQAGRTLIKENVNKKKNYEWNEDQQRIIRINILKESSKGRRIEVIKSINLTELEGRFFWHLPYASEQPKSVIEICSGSNITGKYDIYKIMEFVKSIRKEEIIELYEISKEGEN